MEINKNNKIETLKLQYESECGIMVENVTLLDGEISIPSPLSNFIERNYETYIYYFQDVAYQFLLKHVNGLCLIGIDENNPIFKNKYNILSIEWTKITDELDDKKISTVKKRKRKGRGVFMKHNTILCNINCSYEDKSIIVPIYCCINGNLIEKNENLLKNPNLLFTKRNETHLAIILPNGSTEKEIQNSSYLKRSNI
eukprot:TRINITY_DN4954_c0_g1_i1.p1 TRINITY_DN4954_c0_g1~~TRINITY_DN4954_c0_g1_i1.p1  ORF type:complete len:227 (-),score=50.21 TRINITY_DN4954_c0_g1_i1:89-682(-)